MEGYREDMYREMTDGSKVRERAAWLEMDVCRQWGGRWNGWVLCSSKYRTRAF